MSRLHDPSRSALSESGGEEARFTAPSLARSSHFAAPTSQGSQRAENYAAPCGESVVPSMRHSRYVAVLIPFPSRSHRKRERSEVNGHFVVRPEQEPMHPTRVGRWHSSRTVHRTRIGRNRRMTVWHRNDRCCCHRLGRQSRNGWLHVQHSAATRRAGSPRSTDGARRSVSVARAPLNVPRMSIRPARLQRLAFRLRATLV